jgi:NAD binding domain of 6-phosphogluconate dehydrogenase
MSSGADGPQAETLGYLGLGMMGFPMARRLLNAGFEVSVWNRSGGKAAGLVETGARLASSPRDVASAASIIFICVTNAKSVEEVVFGTEGLAAVAGGGKLVVDFSSIHPDAARAIAARLKAANGMRWIDAPVSGGTKGAEEGTLAVMAGGDVADIERVRPYVLTMARRLTHMGPIGAGQTAKLCNQVIVGCHGGSRGSHAASSKQRDRCRQTAGGARRRFRGFHSTATIRSTHGARHPFASVWPYRYHAEGSRYSCRRCPNNIDTRADGDPCGTNLQTGQDGARRRCGRARDL